MTLNELKTHFNISEFNIEEIQDFIELELFDLKKFFTTKVPVSKLFSNRLKKLRHLQELNSYMFNSQIFNEKIIEYSFENTTDIETIHLNYSNYSNLLKFEIYNSNSPIEIENLVKHMIQLEKKYASFWFLENSWDEHTIVSKPSDPMLILNAIKSYNLNSKKTFDDLKNFRNNPPSILINEMKRLSLLFEKY